jgi:hypothetical protein
MPKLIHFLIIGFMFSCLEKPSYDDDDDDDDEDEESDHEGDNAGECGDGQDNDGDGFVDCDDWDCLDKPACTESDTGPDSDTDNNNCGGTAPVIQTVNCENSGIVDHPDYGPLPTFTLYVNATDEDGDLTFYQLLVDIDPQLNGVKDSDAVELSPVSGSLSDQTCDVSEANVGYTIYLQGGPPDFNIPYEWYVQISDAMGLISDSSMVVCTTPDSDGTGTP